MKQITIQTAKAQILIVDLPQDAHHVQLSLNKHSDILYLAKGSPFFVGIEIPNEDWQLLGKASELTEEQWRTIVDIVWQNENDPNDVEYMYYPDNGENMLPTATESGSSLLSANGVMLSNPLGEEPIQEYDHENRSRELDLRRWYSEKHSDWQAAQEKVWSNPYVLIQSK